MDAGLFLTIGAVWLLLPIIALFFPLLRVRFQRFSRERIAFDDVRPHLVTLLVPEGEALVRRGFELVSPVRVHDFDATARDARDGYHLVHRSESVHAYLRPSPSPDRERPVMIVFESFVQGSDGVVLLATLHARFTGNDLASARRIEHFAHADDTPALFDAHLARRSELGHEVLSVDDDDALARSAEGWNAGLTEAIARREWIAAPEPGWLRMTLRSALSYAVRKRFDTAWRKRTQESTRISATQSPAPVEEEVDALARIDELLARPLVRAQSLTLFVLGTLVFVGWYGWDGWEIGLVLSAVILFHEAGHGLAMWLVGYRDVRIYFIPFFGGAASGLKRDASIHQEALVLLAGPMPGVVLAGVLTALAIAELLPPSPLVVEIVLMLFAINYLNLLPVFPLDGGRIAHRLVAGRLPVVEILLRVVAAVVLGAAALSGLGVILGLLALFLLIGMPGAWRLARLERELRRAGADALVGDARVTAIFRALPGVRGWSPRMMLARQLELRLAAPDATWFARIAWGAVYSTCLLAPLPILLAAWATLYMGDRVDHVSTMFEPERELACSSAPIEIDPSATLVFCHADPSTVMTLTTTLSSSQQLQSWCVPPPWSEGEVSAPHALARATVIELQRVEVEQMTRALRDPVTLARRVVDRSPPDRGPVLAHVEARRAAADFDAVAADLWLSGDPALVARMGGTAACESVWIQGMLEDQIAIGPAPNGSADLRPASRWLCEHGCRTVGFNHWQP